MVYYCVFIKKRVGERMFEAFLRKIRGPQASAHLPAHPSAHPTAHPSDQPSPASAPAPAITPTIAPLSPTLAPVAARQFAVTVITPPGYAHSAAFAEVAESIHYGLLALGHDSVLTQETMLPGRQHIVLGSNLLPHYPHPLAPDAILYNLEQIEIGSGWLQPALLDLFRQHTVWDYSEQNALALASLGITVQKILPIGYVPQLTRLPRVPAQDIDVLFFGSINPRREQVLQQMRERGLQVHAPFGVYGAERDQLIARAKLLLNVHYYEAKVLEMVRISYLLANHCTVLSEHSANRVEDAQLARGVAFADYADLAQRACDLLAEPEQCRRLAQAGFELMQERQMTTYLRQALAGA
jgi:hypothetical protein